MPDYLPLWLIFVATVLIIVLAEEAGFRLGRYRHEHARQEKESSLGTVVGASLGLLAFMSVFSPVMLLNADLERPFTGMLEVSKQVLVDLRRSMGESVPSTSSQVAPRP